MSMDSSVQKLPRAQVCVDTCTHYFKMLLYWRIKLVMINLLHSAATLAVNLSDVLTTLIKVSSWLLAQKKVALGQEMDQ